jgi:hypothetical protein
MERYLAYVPHEISLIPLLIDVNWPSSIVA